MHVYRNNISAAESCLFSHRHRWRLVVVGSYRSESLWRPLNSAKWLDLVACGSNCVCLDGCGGAASGWPAWSLISAGLCRLLCWWLLNKKKSAKDYDKSKHYLFDVRGEGKKIGEKFMLSLCCFNCAHSQLLCSDFVCVIQCVCVCMSLKVCVCVRVRVLWTERTDNGAAWEEEAAWEMISTALIIREIS